MNTLDQILQIAGPDFSGSLEVGELTFGTQEVEVKKEDIIRFIQFLQQQGMDFLVDITGVHYPDQSGRELCVVYHVQNMRSRERVRIKSYTSIEDPTMPSLTGIYSAANWMERETYDFFGIRFGDHPNLKRILNVDEMDYFPMRKEFPLEDQTREDKDDTMFGRQPMNKL